MIRSFRYVSLLLLAVLLVSCSGKQYPSRSTAAIVPVDEQVQKLGLQLDFGKTHLSGMLVVRKMEDGELRIIGTSHFGLSFFDFGLKSDTMQVYSCIEPMRKKQILSLLENDFKLLFLPDRQFRKIVNETEYTKFVTGRWFSKVVVYTFIGKESVQAKHPWLRLSIQLKSLE